MKKIFAFALLFLVLFQAAVFAEKQTKTDRQIRQSIIRKSITSYPWHCPCPYNRTYSGYVCGKRSAYVNPPKGFTLLCYESDVSDEMVRKYRKEHDLG
ncbi:MAG: hypothetical protein WC484_08685 [Candidatus Omnitrophota bacterium]